MGILKKIVIGDLSDPYLTRWFIIPRNRFLNIYLHRFHRSDDDRALHDHPWWSVGMVLRGGYWDVTPLGRKWLRPGAVKVRSPETAHRVELPEGSESWSLFITGPRVREWGFHCPQGWRHWRDFTAPTAEGGESGKVGRGCDE